MPGRGSARATAPRPRLRALPPHARSRRPCGSARLPADAPQELIEGLAAHRACGFHSQRWADDFRGSARARRRPRADRRSCRRWRRTPTTSARPRPRRSAPRRSRRSRRWCRTGCVIGRVDRVELSKNILRGFQAFGELLEAHPEHRERVVFVANAYASRTGVPGYSAYRERVEHEVRDDQRAVRHRRLGADRARRRGRLPPLGGAAAPRRRAAREPDPRRPQPRRVGGRAGQRARRACSRSRPRRRVGAPRRRPRCATPPFDVAGTAAVLHEALTMPADERADRAAAPPRHRRGPHPADWLDDQLAAARSALELESATSERGGRAAPSGPSTRRCGLRRAARSEHVRRAHRDLDRRHAALGSRSSASKAGRSPRSSPM